MNNQEKRDLPEVVAEILIEQHAVREEIVGLRQEMRENHQEMVRIYENQTNAILDLMSRTNDRIDRTNANAQQLDTRVTNLENPAAQA